MKAEEKNRVCPVVHRRRHLCEEAHKKRRTAGSVIKHFTNRTKNSDGNRHRSFNVPHTPHVRGGSVSRRGLN